jgi:hypothetical protein
MSAVTDEDLLAWQDALQEQGREMLARLDLDALVADVGPLLVTGSFVSGPMAWREVDVVLAGRDFSPRDVMGLMARVVARPGVTGLEYRDERGARCVTDQVGLDIYTAVVDGGVRTLAEFAAWLDRRGRGEAG